MHTLFYIIGVPAMLASFVASHNIHTDTNAESTSKPANATITILAPVDDGPSLVDFKLGFSSSEIVPEILAAFNPSVSFFVGFTANDGTETLLEPGRTLSAVEAKAPFEISVKGISNASNITSSTRFIVYMIGPDVPSRSNPTSRNVRHFLAGNLTLSSKSSDLLTSATVLRNTSAATNEYSAPAPGPNTGSHRYLYLFYTQPTALNTRSFASLGFNASLRTGFNLTSFRTLAGLGASIGGTFFEINTDNSTVTPGNASTTGSPPSSRPSETTSGDSATRTSQAAGGSGSTSPATSTSGSARLRWSFVANLGVLAALMGASFVAIL